MPEDSKGKINFGTEYGYDTICLRIGYERLLGRENLTKTGFRLGFGVKIRGIMLDSTFIPQGNLGNTLSFSLTF
ncbi:MAG: hypothetical protein AB1630_05205 [bacterium]